MVGEAEVSEEEVALTETAAALGKDMVVVEEGATVTAEEAEEEAGAEELGEHG